MPPSRPRVETLAPPPTEAAAPTQLLALPEEAVRGHPGRPASAGRGPEPDLLDPRSLIGLRALCDTLVPSLQVENNPGGFYGRRATDLGVDADVVRIVASYLSPDQRRDFLRFVRAVESPLWNFLLTGRPGRLSHMAADDRERYILGWSNSRLAVRRRAFHALKRLVLFLFYAKALPSGYNPSWPVVGYDGPDPRERAMYRHPPELSLDPLRPEGELALDADVCVVGSGAGGGVVAAKLADAGHRVVVLEAGPYRTADDFTQLEAESYENIFQGHGVMTTEDLAIGILAGQTAGGSTTVNWMTCLRTPPWTREEWERDHGMEGLAGPAFDAHLDEVWRRLHVTTEESEVNPSNDVLRRGSEALGYRFGEDYEVITRNARNCQARCDFCFYGCIYNAKQSTLVTYLPDARRAGARFLFQTKADHVVVEAGEARGVEATFRSGDREVPVHVRAPVVVAAGSALQTPSLLWRSGIRFPGVGRGLRLHPNTGIVGEFPDPVRMWEGPMQTIVVRKFQASVEGHHGPVIETVPAHPGLAAMAVPWFGGRAHKDFMLRLAHLAPSVIFVRDVAEGRVRTDARGEPVVDYRLTAKDREHLLLGLRETARIHRAAGARRVFSLHVQGCSAGDGRGPIPDAEFEDFLERLGHLGILENALAMFSAHPMGSARAGFDPRTSTADPTGECHEVRNLWIGDGSLFPTAPGVNPMISIMALAIRTSSFIHERLRQGP